jgi:hypothetical protein
MACRWLQAGEAGEEGAEGLVKAKVDKEAVNKGVLAGGGGKAMVASGGNSEPLVAGGGLAGRKKTPVHANLCDLMRGEENNHS